VGLDYDAPPHVVGDRLNNNPQIAFNEPLRRAIQARVLKIVKQWQEGKTEFDEREDIAPAGKSQSK
jgi:hypothetical protein